MRKRLILGMSLGLAFLAPLLPRGSLAQSPRGAEAGPAGNGILKTYGSRDMRNFTAQKQARAYSRATSSPPPVDKRSRAAVFAKGVRDYYPDTRANQSRNSNVIDPRTLCVPGRKALLQR